LFYSTNYYKNI